MNNVLTDGQLAAIRAEMAHWATSREQTLLAHIDGQNSLLRELARALLEDVSDRCEYCGYSAPDGCVMRYAPRDACFVNRFRELLEREDVRALLKGDTK
jgi:hypothetical protein